MANAVTIGFVGGGNMAEAILKGLINRGQAPQDIIVGEPVVERRNSLENQYKVKVTDSNADVVANSDVIVLAIKPQMVDAVAPGLASNFDEKKLLLSILAGTSTETLTDPDGSTIVTEYDSEGNETRWGRYDRDGNFIDGQDYREGPESDGQDPFADDVGMEGTDNRPDARAIATDGMGMRYDF